VYLSPYSSRTQKEHIGERSRELLSTGPAAVEQ